jgi:hypothetical protein
MRRLARKAAAWVIAGAVAVVTTGESGCSSSKPTELVPGVLTQMQVPRDIDGIEIEVRVNGARTFCVPQAVSNGTVDLPRTLGILAGDATDSIVTVIVRAFNDSQKNTASSYGCSTNPLPAGVANGPTIVRSSTQTYVAGHELYLPMPIRFSCVNEGCAAETAANPGHEFTCKGGQCVDVTASDIASAAAVSAKLVDFTPSLVNGTDACFSPNQCFPPAVQSDAWTAVPVDATQCIYGLSPGALEGSGLNVRVFYEQQQWTFDTATQEYEHAPVGAGEVEILDLDPAEGFIALPNQQFQLAPGLCKLVHQSTQPPAPPALPAGGSPPVTSTYLTINTVQVSDLCSSKVTLLPICESESNFNTVSNLPDGGASTDGICNVGQALLPTPSALFAVMDDSRVMSSALGPSGSAKVLNLSLTDPIFKRTSAAFTFLPHDPNECPGGSNAATPFTPSIPFGLANTVQSEIAQAIDSWTAPDPTSASPAPLDLLAAMRSPGGAYDQVAAVFSDREAPDIAAVMFFVNRLPDPATGNECPVAGNATAQAFEAAANRAFAGIDGTSVRTFFVVLGNSSMDPSPFGFFSQVANEAAPGAVTTIDAQSSEPTAVLQNFSSIITELATCLYEFPIGVDVTHPPPLQVQYVDPFTQAVVTIPRDLSCNEGTQLNANGWNFDSSNRLRICGNTDTSACGALRNVIIARSAVALANNEAAPDLPVTATVLCSGTADVVDSGATPPPRPDASVTADGGAEAGVVTDSGSNGSDASAAADAGADATIDAAEGDAATIDGAASDAPTNDADALLDASTTD